MANKENCGLTLIMYCYISIVIFISYYSILRWDVTTKFLVVSWYCFLYQGTGRSTQKKKQITRDSC
jgi:hypothetical protein